MGLNNDNAHEPLVLDIETVAHDCAAEFIEAPDLDAITAAKNLRDPEKIAADIAKRRADAEEEYLIKLSRAGLDWNVSRIVAIGWSDDGGESVVAHPCATEDDERAALARFWAATEDRLLLGFYARTFDVPTLIQRSRLLDVPFRNVNLARYGRGSVIDLYDILTFDNDSRGAGLMPRTLKAFARRFGLPVQDDVDGADIQALVDAGEWAKVISHVTSDVQLTAGLARRIGVLRAREVVGA